jgi:hypothetical protein
VFLRIHLPPDCFSGGKLEVFLYANPLATRIGSHSQSRPDNDGSY